MKGARRLGVCIGNWLTVEEGKRLIAAFDASTPKQRRNRALIAVLIGCGLRRAEAAVLKIGDIQLREEHWVIADLRGKGGHIRIVPMAHWVKRAIDEWAASAAITSGPLFKAINKAGRAWGNGFTPKVIWSIVKTHRKGRPYRIEPIFLHHSLRMSEDTLRAIRQTRGIRGSSRS